MMSTCNSWGEKNIYVLFNSSDIAINFSVGVSRGTGNEKRSKGGKLTK